MGKFDGILLGVDFDGTLANKASVSAENAEAIRYFQKNGGMFTLISGRNPKMTLEKKKDFVCNAPVVGFNGALVMDPVTGELLYKGGRNEPEIFEFIRSFWERDDAIHALLIHSRDMDGTFNFARSEQVRKNEWTDVCGSIDEMMEKCAAPYFNVICVTDKDKSAPMRDEMIAAANGRFKIARSWAQGVEINNPGEQKGDGVRRLRELTGARLVVTAGDFENDLTMITAADISYAVANAVPEIKAAAKRQTVDCREHAIAAIIREIEEKDL